MSVYDLQHDELPKSDIPEMAVRLTEAVNALDEIDDDFSRQEVYERNEYVMEIIKDVRSDLMAINIVLRRVTDS
jgi:uncharacterized protein YydD (DUF2326 family)